MDGDKRREELQQMLKEAKEPLSGSKLGKILGVSRQVIVQDIALLRAQGLDIIATARGYVLYKNTEKSEKRIIMLQHSHEAIEDELNTIVDFGGVIRNVVIEHPIYGEIIGNMMVRTRQDVQQFIHNINRFETYPLMNLTDGIHMHTIEARNKSILDDIEYELNKKGYLYKGE